ncbi:hypothetical protein ACIOUG_02685 [Pseudomonas sp. NPDC087803]|uniref:terpene synthase family protein n=1 Tax=Pseudomonas sp. NPDC087803 TaxID=3364448 RepID=UPI0037FEE427
MNYSLPLILQGLEIPLNPLSEEAERHTREWLKGVGLEAGGHETHQLDLYLPGKYGGYMWPNAEREDLYILSDLTGWFSCQDDLADEDLSRSPEILEKVLRQVHDVASGRVALMHKGVAGGLANIIERAGFSMSERWKGRTLDQYTSYIHACMCAAVHRVEGTQPVLADYESIWRHAGGFQVCIEFTYFATRIDLPSVVYFSAQWQTLRTITLNLMKAVNDLLSYRIMENPDEDVYNLLTHLRHHQGLSPDQAAAEVRLRIEVWARMFFDLQTRLPDELDRLGCDVVIREQALRCAEAFREQWIGNIGWHLAVPRYREIRFRPD